MENKLSVVLADDHTIVRHAVKTILENAGEYQVVAESSTVETTVEAVRQHKPDLLILDLGLPGKSGLEAIYEIQELNLNTHIVVLTMFEDEATVRQTLSAGANAYVFKNSSPEEFLRALSIVRSGKMYLPEGYQHLPSEVRSNGAIDPRSKDEVHDPLAKLSKREREVFYLLADGMPNRVIAKKLFISPRTVETHRARVIKKLGFGSTADLIRYAIRNNLLTL